MKPTSPLSGLGMIALTAAACGTSPAEDTAAADVIGPVTVTISDSIGTVAVASWTTSQPERCQALFGMDGALVQHTPLEAEPSTDHKVALLGLKAGTPYSVVVQAGEHSSEPVDFITAPLPGWMPTIQVQSAQGESAPEGFTIVPIGLPEGDTAITILDGDGDLVWYYKTQEFVTRARLSPDGDHVVIVGSAYGPDDDVTVTWLDWHGSEEQSATHPGLHTDFAVLPDGSVAALGREVRSVGEPARRYMGETIVELHKDGSSEVVWSVFDLLPPDPDKPYFICNHDQQTTCYSHVNWIAYNEPDDSFLLTAYYLEAAFEVRRDTWEMPWILSNSPGSLEVPDLTGPVMLFPHSVLRDGDRILLLDNTSPFAENCTAALIFDLDLEQGQALPSWQYEGDACRRNHFLGNAQWLSDDGVLVAYAIEGQIDMVSADGTLRQRLSLPFDTQFRYAEHLDSLYGPH